MNKLRYIWLFVGLGFTTAMPEPRAHQPIYFAPTKLSYTVGETITIGISAPSDTPRGFLVIQNAWASSIMEIDFQSSTEVTLPTQFIQKSGLLILRLMVDNKLAGSKQLWLSPQPAAQGQPEVYTGPRFLLAGGEVNAMMVATPLDSLDNPLNSNTAINFKLRSSQDKWLHNTVTEHLFAYYIFPSSNQKGIMSGHVTCGENSSPDYDFYVTPNLPEDFSISFDRLHQEADGHQLIKFTTGVIRDSLNNIVADGTLVKFKVKNENQEYYLATGLTVNGVAQVDLPFPVKAEKWQIKAFISGYAQSDPVSLDFSNSLGHMPWKFYKNNRLLTLGPLKTTFGNTVADGTNILVDITGEDLHKQLMITTFQGSAEANLGEVEFPDGIYEIVLNCGGLQTKIPLTKIGT